MTIEVVFAPEAENDLIALYDYLADATSADRALTYAERIRSYCLSFKTFPERGTSREDVRAGLRTIGFERRVTIAFHLTSERVVIDRILYGGRDVEGLFEF